MRFDLCWTSAEDYVDSLFSFTCGADDEALIVLQHLQPVMNVGRAVAETPGGFKACVVDECRNSDFRDQFFFAVGGWLICSKRGCCICGGIFRILICT